MTEREMLELAAKACGIDGVWVEHYNIFVIRAGAFLEDDEWNPLRYPSDCADMEARLMIDVDWFESSVETAIEDPESKGSLLCFEENYADHNNDRQLARMMASTRAAAALAEVKNG